MTGVCRLFKATGYVYRCHLIRVYVYKCVTKYCLSE